MLADNSVSGDVTKQLFSGSNEPESEGQQAPYALPPAIGPHFREALARSPLGAAAHALAPAVAPVAGPVMGAANKYGITQQIGNAVAPGMGSVWGDMSKFDKPSKNMVTGRSDFSNAGPPKDLQEFLYRLAHMESGGNPTAVAKCPPGVKCTASGAFQYTDPTWNNRYGYTRAKDAPLDIQYKAAQEDMVNRLQHHNGDLPASALTHLLGADGVAKMLKKPELLFKPLGGGNGNTTPISYLSGLLSKPVVDSWVASLHGKNAHEDMKSSAPYNLPANAVTELAKAPQ